MKLNILNQSNNDNINKNVHMFNNFYQYAKNELGFDRDIVCLKFVSDEENAGNVQGRTAYYDVGNEEIVLYVDGRHMKDVLRSFGHELVHHMQNCKNEFDKDVKTFEGYAQEDEHLRNMEREAYLFGNMTFRDWEDRYKRAENLQEGWTKKTSRLQLERRHGKR